MDKYDWRLLGSITKVMVVAIILAWWISGFTVGVGYTTVGTVKLYEQSSWVSPHTWVVLETFGGIEADITLVGYHNFEFGQAYYIRTVKERGGFLNLALWQKVYSIEPVS